MGMTIIRWSMRTCCSAGSTPAIFRGVRIGILKMGRPTFKWLRTKCSHFLWPLKTSELGWTGMLSRRIALVYKNRAWQCWSLTQWPLIKTEEDWKNLEVRLLLNLRKKILNFKTSRLLPSTSKSYTMKTTLTQFGSLPRLSCRSKHSTE